MLHPEQIKALKAMSAEQKLQVAMDLYWSARRLKEAAIRQQHPDWPEEKVKKEVRESFLYARD
jgi:hypothetical protein